MDLNLGPGSDQPNTSPLGHAGSHLRVGVSAVVAVFVGMHVLVWVCGRGCGGVGVSGCIGVVEWYLAVFESHAWVGGSGCVGVWM